VWTAVGFDKSEPLPSRCALPLQTLAMPSEVVGSAINLVRHFDLDQNQSARFA
jgi:hypothetical protein